VEKLKNILIIDDEYDIRETLKDILEVSGYRVITAAHGEAGLKALEDEEKPGLIFLDLMMPRMNGFEFMERKDATPEYREIPVVVISADSAAETKAKSMNVNGCLKKPIHLDSLLEVAQKYCAV